MPAVLTIASQVMCMHGGTAVLITSNSTLSVNGSPVLLVTDQHTVVGCPFTPGTTYSPCVVIQWSGPATALTVNGAGVLTETSIGNCLNAEGAPQGIAIVSASAPELEAI